MSTTKSQKFFYTWNKFLLACGGRFQQKYISLMCLTFVEGAQIPILVYQ